VKSSPTRQSQGVTLYPSLSTSENPVKLKVFHSPSSFRALDIMDMQSQSTSHLPVAPRPHNGLQQNTHTSTTPDLDRDSIIDGYEDADIRMEETPGNKAVPHPTISTVEPRSPNRRNSNDIEMISAAKQVVLMHAQRVRLI
jgi:hypothetical protein